MPPVGERDQHGVAPVHRGWRGHEAVPSPELAGPRGADPGTFAGLVTALGGAAGAALLLLPARDFEDARDVLIGAASLLLCSRRGRDRKTAGPGTVPRPGTQTGLSPRCLRGVYVGYVGGPAASC